MAIPNDLRQINRRQVVLALLRSRVATRTDLAREIGLSLPTTGKIVDELLAAGVFEPVPMPAERSGPGRPGHLLKLDDTRPRFLAVQLGPVNTRLAPLAVAPPTATAGDDWAAVIPTPPSLDRWTAAVTAAASRLTDGRLLGVLVSVPGLLDEATGRTLLSPNARWMEGAAIAPTLGRALGLPAYAIQEIGCLALGHQLADPTAGDFLLVDFGIGVGSAAMIRGELLRSQLSFTGEMGHTPVPGNPAPCGCGGVGCLETLVGRRHLLDPAAEDADALSGSEVAHLADAPARARVRSAMAAAGLGIAGALNVLGLNHVVVTGSVADLPAEALDGLRSAVTAGAIAGRLGTVRVETARRHRLAGLASLGIDKVIAPG